MEGDKLGWGLIAGEWKMHGLPPASFRVLGKQRKLRALKTGTGDPTHKRGESSLKKKEEHCLLFHLSSEVGETLPA